MKKRFLLLPCLLLVLGLALSACGGGGSSSSSGGSDESQIEETIEMSATSTEPSACTEYSTQEFMEQTTNEEGPAAVKACEKSAEEGESAESVEVTQVEVEGSEATAEAKFTGGQLDGQSLAVGLVKEEGTWKLESIVGFTHIDKAALAEQFTTKLEEEGGAEAELAPCFAEGVEEAGQSELEELMFGGSPVPAEELVEACQE
jgi:hypothetical protein